MSELHIKNKIIHADAFDILNRIRMSAPQFLRDIDKKNDYVSCTCPFHKFGTESHPSCSVYNATDNDKVPFGTFNCFTCHESGSLVKFVSQCLSITNQESEKWLMDNFGEDSSDYELLDMEKLLAKPSKTCLNYFLDPSVLKKFEFYHPYMWQRKLSQEVVDKFEVGYDKETNSITFPVYDHHKNLVMITKRRVDSKVFMIDEDKNKPVYLLYEIINNNYPYVIVVESQINALTAWSYGYPAIALFGTGSDYQYEILKKSGLHNFVLCFDGDFAGRKGTERFIKNVGQLNIYKCINMPNGKDLNDLSKSEFDEIFEKTPEYIKSFL